MTVTFRVVTAVLLLIAPVLLMIAYLELRRARLRARDLEQQVADLRDAQADPTVPRSLQAAERAVRTVTGTATRMREQGVGGMMLSSIDDLSRWATEDRSEIARLAAFRRTRHRLLLRHRELDRDQRRARRRELGALLIAHDTLVRAHVERRGGHIVKSQRDGFMIVITSPVDAVKAGLGVQRALRSKLRVRIGVPAGTVIARDGDYFGQTVATAARVAARAVGGEILVTQPVADDLPDDGRFTLLGGEPADLRGVPGEHALWQVGWRRG